MTGQARLPLVVEVIPAFKIELAQVQSQQLCPFDQDFSLSSRWFEGDTAKLGQ